MRARWLWGPLSFLCSSLLTAFPCWGSRPSSVEGMEPGDIPRPQKGHPELPPFSHLKIGDNQPSFGKGLLPLLCWAQWSQRSEGRAACVQGRPGCSPPWPSDLSPHLP